VMVEREGSLEREIIPLQACMVGTSSVVGASLPIGEREAEPPSQISYVDLDSGMRRSELHRVQHPHVEVGWREILSWYSVERAMEIVMDPSVAQQDFLCMGNTGTPDWHWDPGGITYHFLGRLVACVLEGTVGQAVEHVHVLREFGSAPVANQFMGRLPRLFWYDIHTRDHGVVSTP